MSTEKVTQVRPLGDMDGEAPHCRSGPHAQSHQHILMSQIIKDLGWHARSIFVSCRELYTEKGVNSRVKGPNSRVTELIPAEQVPTQEDNFSLNHS